MRKKSVQPSILELIFPDIYKSVAVALLTHYPALREADMQLILRKKVADETERFIAKTARDEQWLKNKLELSDEQVEMVIHFNRQLTPMATLVRNESNDAFIDTTIAWEARKTQRAMHLPNRRQ